MADRHRAPPTAAALRLAALPLIAAMLLPGCQSPPPAPQPAVRAAPRHSIQPPTPDGRPAGAVSSSTADGSRLNTGPNAVISRTPDMAPRLDPAPRPVIPSAQADIDALRETLQQQRRRPAYTPGPPMGIIDERPGTIHPESGIIQVPH